MLCTLCCGFLIISNTQDARRPGLVPNVGPTCRVVPHEDHSQVGPHVALGHQLLHITLDLSVNLTRQLCPRDHHGSLSEGGTL